jgi:hypothetical protein
MADGDVCVCKDINLTLTSEVGKIRLKTYSTIIYFPTRSIIIFYNIEFVRLLYGVIIYPSVN